jgi:hypothetical protein
MNDLADKDLVRLCVEELSKSMGYAHYQKVLQRDYEHLCQVIEEKTGILISLSTIKRIFAGKFERLPQMATLNALTLFIGYEGWQDFKTKKLLEQSRLPLPAASLPTRQEIQPRKKKTGNKPFLKATGIFILLSMGLFILLLSVKQKGSDLPNLLPADVHFSAKKAVAQGVPNSVVFSYNIDQVPGDSFFIQQSWDTRRRVPIKKHHYTLTDIYYEPGYHKAKLISNNKVIKEVVVSIPTGDWMAYSKTPTEPYPQYFQTSLIKNQVLGLTRKDLAENAINVEQDRNFYYSFFSPVLNAGSDYFKLKARIRTRTIKPTRCPVVLMSVFGENSMLYFTTTIPGCISDINALFSDKYISGKTSDLSGLGADILNWQDIEIQVINRKVKLLMNEKPVFAEQYNKPVGLIKGMGFVSNGLCEVDWVELQDSTGRSIYRNDFNQQPL